jgi:hypothetical protein
MRRLHLFANSLFITATVLSVTGWNLAFAADYPGLQIIAPPSVCNAIGPLATRFELVYDTRVVATILPLGDKLLDALRTCDIALLEASGDFPTSPYLSEKRTAFNLEESQLSLRLGYAALRANQQKVAKAYFIDANKTASFVGDSASTDDRASALDTMKKSKAEADQLEKDGF